MPAEHQSNAAGSTMYCRGCGYECETHEPLPFRCPNAGSDDVDHLLRRRLDAGSVEDASAIPGRTEENPFLRYRELLHVYRAARANGLSDDEWMESVEHLDREIASVAGARFRPTPFFSVPELAERLGTGSVWVKDESGNVSGSHKGRHLFGIMLWLEAAGRLGLLENAGERPLAIASCGNAALAAATVARAAERRLEVFVPTHANPLVLQSLIAHGAHVHECPRRAGEAGDPSYLRFREALASGALPFTCQGNENGLTLDGGKTLAWEMASTLAAEGQAIDRLFLHVGGGALASSVIDGLREAVDLGLMARIPRIHAVQTTGCQPLVRAYRLVVARLLHQWQSQRGGPLPEDDAQRAEIAAAAIVDRSRREALDYAVTHRSEFMWPWEEEPRSIADGILDDETYDWVAVVEGMLETAGWPVVVSEDALSEANRLIRETTGIEPCHTGTAGVAGALELAGGSILELGETVALVVSGADRTPGVHAVTSVDSESESRL